MLVGTEEVSELEPVSDRCTPKVRTGINSNDGS
jgi:hypothetical protein